MKTTQKLLNALNLWLELSEVDPGQSSFKASMSGGMDEWTVRRMHDLIKEALELDNSNTTGVLMLDALSSIYFDNRHFSINELMSNPERTAAYVKKAGELKELVRHPEFMARNRDFVSHLRSALKMYGMDSEDTLRMASDLGEVGYLRRDAFRSIKQLRVDQFLSGEPEPEGTAPAYNGWVHQFWNVNSLVEAACRQPSGVTLSLVRDPDDLQSYFVFAVRNGGNLFLLSDVPVHVHPLQKYMSRRPERSFGSRTSRNWFPYDLLNLKYDDDAQAFFADEARRRSLVPQRQTVDRIKAIVELAPQEVLWVVMMFDLIVEKFWGKEQEPRALSYTGAMILEEKPLLEAAQAANLPVVGYKTLSLPSVTREDMTLERAAKAVGKDGGRPNAWLEERYAGRVDESLFNLLDSGANSFYLPPANGSKDRSEHKNHELAVVTSAYVSVLPKDDEALPFWHRKCRYKLHALNSTSFGTREELEDNRIYLARWNQAQAIQRLADAEYNERHEEVIKWWCDRVRKNLDYLLSLAGEGTVLRVYEPTEAGCRAKTSDGYRYTDGTFNFVRTYDENENNLIGAGSTFWLNGGYIQTRGRHRCIVTDAASSFRVLFQPQNTKQISELAGCEISDLPDVLQHWSPSRDHQGNHLLDRVDPMAWALRDPWSKINFRIVMHLSKRGFSLCKKKTKKSAVQ